MASSSAEEQEHSLLELFDCYWFQHTVFFDKGLRGSESKRFFDESLEDLIQKSELSRVNTLKTRSMSDRFLEVELGMTDSDSAASPNSVLAGPRLQTILSGKEGVVEKTEEVKEKEQRVTERKQRRIRRKNKKKGNSKSLSELEFEELKGFMDLGFVFSEQDKNSDDLVAIIPGLQRIGEKQSKDAEEGEGVGKISVPRPYLSEAWEIIGRRKGFDFNPLMNWKVDDLGDEMAVKDQLRFWDHAVASAVR